MKKFEEKAIPLIFRNENKKYQVNPDAVKFFQSIQGKIAIISIAGIYRTGKSYLLNTIILKQKAGFAVGPTTNPKTKGIWVWGKPLILKNQKDQIINVCVVDSQGLGSIQEDVNHDLRLFSLTLLISSMFIYNTLGAIDQHAIDSLGLVLRLCQRLKSESYNDLPDFYWVLRDFSLALVGRDNQPLTPDKYLQQSLSPQPGDSENRNKIRQSIRSSFPQRHCFTFVRPLTNEQQLQKLDTLQIDQLRPEFMEQVIDFRRLINSSIRTKRIKGKQISAEMLLELIKVYTAEINGQELPQIQTGWKYVCARQCQQAMNIVEKQAQQMINKMLDSLPTTKKDLNQKKDALYESLKKLFQSKTSGNDQALSFMPQLNRILEKKIAKVEDQMKLKNTQETKLYIKRQFQNNVEKRLKAGDFKSMGELAKQFQVFYQFYRKKCPYKDEIQTGLECLLKRFSDCSVLFHKAFKTRKDQEISKLREQVDRITHELQVRDQRSKHQKTASSDKLAVLESKIEEINRQNRELSQQLVKSEVQLQKFKREQEQNASKASQEVEIQIINLRKQLMSTQQLVRQAQCIKNFEINNCRNQILLKENQINHILQEKKMLSNKLSHIMGELSSEKDEKTRKIEELIENLQSLKKQASAQKKNLQEKLKNSEQAILNLQNLLQEKVNQIKSLTKKQQAEVKVLQENFQAEKLKISDEKRQQIKSLKEALQNQEEGAVLKIKRMEAEYSQKEMELKMHKLEVQRSTAIINQKLQFLKKECSDKDSKITKLQEENSDYLNMFEQKDNELANFNTMLDESRNLYETLQSQSSRKLEECNQQLQEKIREIAQLEEANQRLTSQLREKQQQNRQLAEKLKIQIKTSEEKIKQLNDRLTWSQGQSQAQRRSLEEQIQVLRAENSKMTDDQKRTAELSLVQLKNYYEMERERLQKRNLQDRKKHQTLEAALTNDLENKHRKAIRALQQELNSIKLVKEQLQENLTRAENEFEQKISTIEQERESQRRRLENRNELLEKKFEEFQSQYELFEKNYQEERIGFVKRMEGLNFELSRKEKELMQLTSKKESLEQTLAKKQVQLDSTKKMMNQEIESSMKKVSQFQQKYQKLNEEYLQFRMQTEKQLALTKQKNEFQANKLSQLLKQKEVGSSKTIQRLDKQRFGDLKQQNQKLKAQILALQGKFQTLRKSAKEQQSNIKKQYATLERDYEFLQQKQTINQAKISQLQSKISQKGLNYSKQIQELKAKHILERDTLNKEIQSLKDKNSDLQEQKSQAIWTLQKDITLLKQKINYSEYQKEALKKQQEENQRKLNIVTNQLKKASEKASEDSQTRKLHSDKKYTNQIQLLKESLRSKCDQYQEILRKQREQIRLSKEKNNELLQKMQALEKLRTDDKSLQQENDSLRKQKETIIMNHRSQRMKEIEQWKKKTTELQRKNKELEKEAMQKIFVLQKENSKWQNERQNFLEKIKGLEDNLQWQRSKNLTKSKTELKKSQSSTYFGGFSTEYSKQWK